MHYSRRIEAALKVFHLERADDKWEDLVVPLRELAEAVLWEEIREKDRQALSMEYSDVIEDLLRLRGSHSMTTGRVNATRTGIRILQAAQDRLLRGDPEPLKDIIEQLQQEEARLAIKPKVAQEEDTKAKEPPSDKVLLSVLAELYLAEQQSELAPASVRDMKSAFKTLADALTDPDTGVELDLKCHTREDMVALKTRLMVGRKPLTVNKLLTRLSTLLTWAINSGYLEKAYNKGLKISKGAESGRKAFSDEQIQTLMDQMAQLPVTSWKRWAMSIGAITGARIGEVYQLTKPDVRRIGGVVVVSINDEDGKTLKNKHSNRLVPLVDGAYGFDLKAFLQYVESCEGKLFDRVAHNFTRVLNETLRDTLQLESGEGLTYHSLRHSLAGLMKYHGIQTEIAQAVMGHSSQTITFDLYGGSQQVGVKKLEDALKVCFLGDQ